MNAPRRLPIVAITLLIATAHGGHDLFAAGDGPNILLFTRAEGFVHNSIVDGIDMINDIAAENGFTVDVTDQTDAFTKETLATYDVTIWLSTTRDVLDLPEELAFEAYLEGGGGYIGIHAAADCEYNWNWYGQELLGNGAWFESHPSIQAARILLESPSHPTAGTWEADTLFTDEWYNFRENPRDLEGVLVIQTLDESSYDPGSGAMGDDHPIAWAHTVGTGRVFYTGLGHRRQTYEDARFKSQILGAIQWASGNSEIFLDGFESGDTGAWDLEVN